jgi:hypothetical protein
MARFMGSVDSSKSRTTPTRLGHYDLCTVARSWTGSVKVYMYVKANEDCVHISLAQGSTTGTDFSLYNVPIAALLDRDARTTLFRALAADVLSDGNSRMAA